MRQGPRNGIACDTHRSRSTILTPSSREVGRSLVCLAASLLLLGSPNVSFLFPNLSIQANHLSLHLFLVIILDLIRFLPLLILRLLLRSLFLYPLHHFILHLLLSLLLLLLLLHILALLFSLFTLYCSL